MKNQISIHRKLEHILHEAKEIDLSKTENWERTEGLEKQEAEIKALIVGIKDVLEQVDNWIK